MFAGRAKSTLLGVAGAIALAFLANGPVVADGGPDQIVDMQTTKGPIRMRIFYSIVPYTAGNFLDLVESGFYNGLTFHRIENWVVQGGDPGTGVVMDQTSGQPHLLRLETNPNLTHNQPGMVAMARTNDPNSASCQFYILKCPMPQLNGKYAVFGKVLNGMNAVYSMQRGDKILSATVFHPSENNSASSNSSSSSSSSAEEQPNYVGKHGKPKDSGF